MVNFITIIHLTKRCMAGTYSQVYIQLVFAVKYRECIISSKWKHELYKYIAGIVTNKGHKTIIVNGMPDHVHVFLGLKPAMSIADLARDIKNNSANFINNNNLVAGRFAWQEGYGVFSYSHSHIDKVFRYIQEQEMHHQKLTFRDEYVGLLNRFEVEFKDEYLFDWID